MKEWFTAAELAGVTGMPATQQAVTRRAKREDWAHRNRAGQGGGREYHFSSLPEATQTALHFKQAPPPETWRDKALAVKEPANQPLAGLKTWQRRIFEARLTLYREFEQLQRLHGTNKAAAVLVGMAKQGTLPEHLMHCVGLANARKGEERSLSRSMILGWQRAVRHHGVNALAPRPMERPIAPAWTPYFLKCYQLPSNPTIPEAMEQMAKILPEGMRLPSYYQVLRWHNKRSALDQEKHRRTGSAYQALKGYRKRDTSGYRPLTIGQCDGHSFKAYVAHPVHGRPFHPEVCAVLDAATKMAMGWSAGLAESALTVAAAVRNAAMVDERKPYGGVFDILYTDGGSGNIATVNTDDVTGLFARIGTTFSKGRPGNPQGRGFVEVTNKSLWIRGAKQLPACTASTMDKGARRNIYLAIQKDMKQQGKSDHLLSWPQFLDFCQGLIDSYNRRPHSALPKLNDPETGRKRHMSPLECLAWHIADGWDPKEHQLSEAEIETLWLPREARTVQRATVQLGNNHYFHKDLAHYDRREVQVAYYPADASRVQVWDMEGRLICHAWYEKNTTDFFPRTMVEQAQAQRTKRRAEIKKMNLQEIYGEQRGVIEIVSNPAPAAKIVPFPVQPQTIKVDREQLAARMREPKALEIPHDDRGKYRLWQSLDRQIQAGETLEEPAMRFYEAYRQTGSWRAFRSVEERLGAKQA